MPIADWIDAALTGLPGYEQGRAAPYELDLVRQRARRAGLENQSIQSTLDDLKRERAGRAQAEAAYPGMLDLAAPRPGNIARPGAMDLSENPEAAGTPAVVTPARPAASNIYDLKSRGASPSDVGAVQQYRPDLMKSLALESPRATQEREQLSAAIDALPLDPATKAVYKAMAQSGSAEGVRALLEKRYMSTPAGVFDTSKGEYAAPPGGANGVVPKPEQVGGTGMWRVPKLNEQTGRVEWSYVFDPNFKGGTITKEDALRSLQAGLAPKIALGKGLNDLTPEEHKLVIDEMTSQQAKAAGQKAATVTVNTGQAKTDLPLGAAAQQWLNAKGEFPSPQMSQRDAIASGFLPYKDAVKRLDQEGASRTFLQHLQFLKEYADQLPESSGNPIGDKVTAEASALGRRMKGKSDPFVSSMTAIDRPAALQMIRAVAPDARAGARLQQKFEEILDPYAGWTKQSYLAAVDALEKMAITGMAQRGRPGMTPQPGAVTVPPAAVGEKSPAPVVPGAASAPQPGSAETLSRKSGLYQRARGRGLTDQQIQERYGVAVTD